MRDASVSNLPRIYQAFYDGFSGTPQRTIGQQAGGGLPVSLNEMGIQTDASEQPGYGGVEVSANSAGGMVGQTRPRPTRRATTSRCSSSLACDPNVRVINIFHLVDEPNLAGWQSGLYWVGTTRPGAEAVGRRCVAGLAVADPRRLPGQARARGRRRPASRRCRPAKK